MSRIHVPAWKRLGLKLKYAKEESPSNSHSELNGTTEPPSKKRRLADAQTPTSKPSPGLTQQDDISSGPPGNISQSKPKKQVSFTNDTKAVDGDTAVSIIPSEMIEEVFPQAVPKKAKKPKQSTQPATTKTQTTLDYLTQYYTSHSTWKFNKNREVWILKHALSTEDIPPTYNLMLAQYIHGLKSQNTRSRLRQECIAAGVDQDGPEMPQEAAEALKSFPGTSQATESLVSQTLLDVPRPRLILWAMDPTTNVANVQQKQTNAESGTTSIVEKSQNSKKRKNRTAVIEYSSSSSSESDSESSTESDSTRSDSDSDSD